MPYANRESFVVYLLLNLIKSIKANILVLIIVIKCNDKPILSANQVIIASVAEWSKATDSSSVLFGGVGSNPTGCITISGY